MQNQKLQKGIKELTLVSEQQKDILRSIRELLHKD